MQRGPEEMKEPSKRRPWVVALACGGVVLLGILGTVYVGIFGSSPTAVCRRLSLSGVAAKCHRGTLGLMGALAEDVVEFDVPDSTASGRILSFASRQEYELAMAGYGVSAIVTRAHPFGSSSALVIVQIGHDAPAAAVKAARSITENL